MTNTELLNERINASGYKRGFLAKKIGISLMSLGRKVNNVTEFKQTEISCLCELLGITGKERDVIFFAK